MIKKSKQHLKDTGWTYSYHLRHSFKQSTKLLVAALKSYIHGIFPSLFISDGPITVVKLYRDIKKLKHHAKTIRDTKSS